MDLSFTGHEAGAPLKLKLQGKTHCDVLHLSPVMRPVLR